MSKNRAINAIEDFKKAVVEADTAPHVFGLTETIKFCCVTIEVSTCIDCPLAPDKGCGHKSVVWRSKREPLQHLYYENLPFEEGVPDGE
jgi:hypothetical protein